MTLEELRQALLKLAELEARMGSFRASLDGTGEDTRKQFNALQKRIEDATPGWELQKMSNAWAHGWVLIPMQEEEAKA